MDKVRQLQFCHQSHLNLFRHFPPTSTALLVCALLLGGCSARQMVIGSLADELAAQGTGNDPDIELVRDASAFYLKLSESVLRQDPAHGRLAESVSSGFAQYAYAFVAFEADKIEEGIRRLRELYLSKRSFTAAYTSTMP
jgi:hypothetical protein